MNMAKASKADMDMAMKLSNALDELSAGRMPEGIEGEEESESIVWFDNEDPEQCKKAVGHLLQIMEGGSISRVVWGLSVLLHPANAIVDPELDHIDLHPRLKQALENHQNKTS